MQDDEDNATRSYATLNDEVLGVLKDAGGWLSSHALLQRCEHARDGDQLGSTLARMVKAGTLKAQADKVGLLYGLPYAPAPTARTAEARGPASAAESQVRERSSEPAPERIVGIRASEVERIRADVRERLIELFQAQPLRSCRELQDALGRCQPVVGGYLRALLKDGLIHPVGKGSTVRYRWSAAQPSPIPPAPETPPRDPKAMGTQAARDAAAAKRAEQPPVKWFDRREQVKAVLLNKPGTWTSTRLAAALEVSANTAAQYFGKLEEEGLVKRHGEFNGTWFELLPALTPPAPAPAQQTPQPAAPTPATPPSVTPRFAFWSDGQFEMHLGGDPIVMRPEVTRHLFAFLDKLGLQA